MARGRQNDSERFLYLGHRGTLRHDCKVVGDVQVSWDWRFCPWCGRGMARRRRQLETPLACALAD